MAFTQSDRNKKDPAIRRKFKTLAVAEMTRAIAGGAFRRQGFAQIEIITRWSTIVGNVLADHCLPEQLKFPQGQRVGGTLYIRADGAFALELQHLEPQVVERINSYCGFTAVARLAIRQAPLPQKQPSRRFKARQLTPAELGELETSLAKTTGPELRKALESLGKAVVGTPEHQPRHSPPHGKKN